MTSPLALLAAFLLAAGGFLALLIPPEPVATPLAAAAPLILLALGILAASAHALLRREAAPGAGALLLALLCLLPVLPPVRGQLTTGATLALLVLGASAMRALRLQGAAFALLLSGLALTAMLGLSQWWHQLDAAQDFALGHALEITESARGRAFLASDRATGTSLVANTFAATLLLALPFLVLALLRSQNRTVALLFLLCTGGAFLAAGSAGALLAGLAATSLCCWRAVAPWRWLARGSALFLALALGLMLTAPTWSAAPEWLVLKSASLAERVDFQTLALRLFRPDDLLQGRGWGHFAPLAEAVLRPGEAWSSSPHSVPLQLALEGGVLLAGAALMTVVWMLRTMQRESAQAIATSAPTRFLALRPGAAPARQPSQVAQELSALPPDAKPILRPDPMSRAVLAGMLCAAILAPLLVPMLTLLPLDFDHPLLAATLMGLVSLIAWRGATALVMLPSGRGALAIGVAAFLLHGLLDSDLFVSSAAAALCLACAAGLPTPPAGRVRALSATIGVTGLACVLVSYLATAEPWRAAQRAAHDNNDISLANAAIETAARHAPVSGDLEAFENAGPLFAERGLDGLHALRAALPGQLHAAPRTALLTLRIAESALRSSRMTAAEALACCESLAQGDSPRRAEILATAARIAATAGSTSLAVQWRHESANAARRWGIKPP